MNMLLTYFPIGLAAMLISFMDINTAQGEEAENPPDTLTGEWRARRQLETNGVAPFAELTTEVWGNVAGGWQTGGWWNQLLDFGAELDTAKLGWWQNGRFMVDFHWVRNSRADACFVDDTGACNPVSGIMAANHFRVFNLYYQHAWAGEKFQIKAGQLAADDDFMLSDYAGRFLNSAFGALPSQAGTPLARCCHYHPAFPIYPVAAPGLFFRAQPRESFYLQTGVYYGKPGADAADNYGFDWAKESDPGVAVFCEGGFNYTLGQRAATLRLGGNYHSGCFDDFAGMNAGNATAMQRNFYSFYFVQDLVLLADKCGQPKLAAFCRSGFSPQTDRSIVSVYADAGLNWFAPLPGRKDDIAGVAFSLTRFSDNYRRFTGADGVAAAESTLELTYQARLTRWLTLQADTQCLFNPAVNPDSHSRETAFVLGMRAVIRF
jgi:porin